MIRGIGVDMVQISEIRRYLESEMLSKSFVKYTFTPGEMDAATSRPNQSEYYAARFAVKEAVFKAVAPLLPEKTFDFRIVETRNREDGSPYVHISDSLYPILEKAAVNTLHLSITTEGDYATAFVIAEGE